MILSEPLRRWSEIKFYYFCLDLFHINYDMIEVILMVEAVAHIGHLNIKLLKSLTGKMLGDPYYLPVKDEVISLAYAYGMSNADICKQFGFNRKTVTRILTSDRNTITHSIPLLTPTEDQELYKFCQVLPKVKKAGVYEKEKAENRISEI